MRAKRICIVAIAVVCIGASAACAQGLDSRSEKALAYPDLAINSINVVPEPRDGRDIDVIVINIMNRGDAGSPECTLGLSCEAIECKGGDKCKDISRAISADIPVPALNPREARNIEWRPPAGLKWVMGKYAIIAYIDKYDVIRELNEGNNIFRRLVYLNTPSPDPYSGDR
jgi:subtilase family serine protease